MWTDPLLETEEAAHIAIRHESIENKINKKRKKENSIIS